MKTLIILSSLLLSLSSLAMTLDEAIRFSRDNVGMGYVYQQKSYMADDVLGDVFLLETVANLPKGLWSQLKKKEDGFYNKVERNSAQLRERYPEMTRLENELLDRYETIPKTVDPSILPIPLEGKKKPFKVKRVVKMFREVIRQEYERTGMLPIAGTPHNWSKDLGWSFHPEWSKTFSKVFLCLARGVAARYLVTGKESALRDYVLTRPMDSVTLEELFRSSYIMNNGDMYLTLLTIENMLSVHWHAKNRDNLSVTRRLSDITNFYYDTDRFGQWYHLFGVMLYGYLEGSFKAFIVGTTEGVGSQLLSRFEDEYQENYINRQGGRIGGKLHRAVKRETYKKDEAHPEYIAKDYYLQLDEDFTKRLKKEMEEGK